MMTNVLPRSPSLLLRPPSERVQALRYLQLTRQLLSCSADGGMAVWNMDTQREEVRSLANVCVRRSCLTRVCPPPPAGAPVAGQRLLPEVRAAVLLEHQADVGQQDPGPQAGRRPPGGGGGRVWPPASLQPAPACLRSTTAGSVDRPSAGSAAPSAPRSPSWASSSPCACATPASTPSKRRSEFSWGLFFFLAFLSRPCLGCLSVLPWVLQPSGVGHVPRGQTQHRPHGHGRVQRPDGHLWQRPHR